MGEESVQLDERIARLAAKQHGVVSIRQLRAMGATKGFVHRRVKNGLLHKIFRGVYAVGHPAVSSFGMWKAATLAVGPCVLLSHLSAAMLWKLLPLDDALPEVTVLRDVRRRPRDGLILHRSTTLMRGDLARKENIPVTSPGRTIADLRRTGRTKLAAKAMRQANWLGLELDDPTNDGTFGPGEPILLEIVRRNGLPAPATNAQVGRFRVDYLWRPESFGVEADDWKGHRGRQAFEDDHERGLELLRRGIELLPLTYRQLTDKADEVAQALRMRLEHAS